MKNKKQKRNKREERDQKLYKLQKLVFVNTTNNCSLKIPDIVREGGRLR